jgi:hypothetical protein
MSQVPSSQETEDEIDPEPAFLLDPFERDWSADYASPLLEGYHTPRSYARAHALSRPRGDFPDMLYSGLVFDSDPSKTQNTTAYYQQQFTNPRRRPAEVGFPNHREFDQMVSEYVTDFSSQAGRQLVVLKTKFCTKLRRQFVAQEAGQVPNLLSTVPKYP